MGLGSLEWRGQKMKSLVLVICVGMMLGGCAAMPDRDRNVLLGAGVGAGVGALVGSATSGPPGAWAGAAIGGAAGAAVGYLIRPEGCFIRNKRGETWQVPCEDRRVRAAACFMGRDPNNLQEVSCRYASR